MGYLKDIGLIVTVYGDDFLLVAPDKYIVDAKDKLLPILEGSSFIINFQKGTVKPLNKYLLLQWVHYP